VCKEGHSQKQQGLVFLYEGGSKYYVCNNYYGGQNPQKYATVEFHAFLSKRYDFKSKRTYFVHE